MSQLNEVREASAEYLAADELVPVGYQKTDVGVIPEDWYFVSIGNLSEIVTGNTPPTSRKDNYGDEYLFVSPADLQGGSYIFDTRKKLSLQGWKLCRAFPEGSILFTCIGSTIGKCAIAPVALTSNQQINAVFPSKRAIQKYVFFQLSFTAGKIREQAGEQAVPIVNKAQFSRHFIALPCELEEQTAIANVLSDVDALINSLEKLIAKKQAIKTATMQQLLTGKTRLPQFALRADGTRKGYKQSELGEIPEDWEVLPLRDMVSELRNGFSYKPVTREGVWITRIETIASGQVDFSRLGYAKKETSLDKYKVQKNDILYSHINSVDHIGKVAIYASEEELFHGINLVLMRTNPRMDPAWLYQFLSSETARKWARTVAKQAVSQASINTTDLRQLLISTPSCEEQLDTSAILTELDCEIQTLQQRLTKTRQIKQGMMQQLLSGKIRLVKPARSDG